MAERDAIQHVHGPNGSLAITVLDSESRASKHETLVFLHPTNLDSRCWLPVARHLPEQRRILIDSRGHGASHSIGPFHVADYADDVCAVIEQLALYHVHLVGGSLGGAVACAVAGKLPQIIASIVAVGAALEPADTDTLARLQSAFETLAIEDIVAAELEAEATRGVSPMILVQIKEQFGVDRRNADLIREITLNAFSEDAREYARHVNCPAWVLTGEFDTSCPPSAGKHMAESLLARFEILPGLGHLAMLEDPDLVADKVLGNLREVEGA